MYRFHQRPKKNSTSHGRQQSCALPPIPAGGDATIIDAPPQCEEFYPTKGCPFTHNPYETLFYGLCHNNTIHSYVYDSSQGSAIACVPGADQYYHPDRLVDPLGGPVYQLFAGGMRSNRTLKELFAATLAVTARVEILQVNIKLGPNGYEKTSAKNGIFFCVQGTEADTAVKSWGKRLRCIGDAVFVSRAPDAEDAEAELAAILPPAGVKHGHPVPIDDVRCRMC